MKNPSLHFISTYALCILQTLHVQSQCSSTKLEATLTPYTYNGSANGEDVAWDVIPIDDGDADAIKNNGYVAVGVTATTNKMQEAIVVRLNSDLTFYQPWVSPQLFGGNGNDVAYSVDQTSNNDLVVCGTKASGISGCGSSKNVWLFKVKLSDGTMVAGSEHVYGGSGQEDGFAVKVDENFFVVAGATGANNDCDLASPVSDISGIGEFWVLKIRQSDYGIEWQRIYHGDKNVQNSLTENDWAWSIIIDHDLNYVVSGFCESCEDDNVNEKLQAMVVTIKPNGDQIWKNDFGYQIPTNSYDQGLYDVIEVYDAVAQTYSYLSSGITHPDGHCFGNHEVYELKTEIDGDPDPAWTPGCYLDEGKMYGSSKKDDGRAAVQTCDGGYLVVGNARFQDNDVSCIVSSNKDDIWILKLKANGDKDWDATIGSAEADIAYSIKQVPDGSLVIAGQWGTNVTDFYVAIIELTCSPPQLLPPQYTGCNAVLRWNSTPCATSYDLRYRLSGTTSWTTVQNVTSPYLISGLGNGTYEWQVRARCSPNKNSPFVTSNYNFVLTGCKIGAADSGSERGLISVYPNPSDGAFKISLGYPDGLTHVATIDILDQVSKVVFTTHLESQNGTPDKQISVTSLPSGFYWIRVSVNGKSYCSKLVLQKP